MKIESEAVITAVDKVLKEGYRTKDIADAKTPLIKYSTHQQWAKQF
jgi:3-isopropylmalate dehydrogenase